jgi:hypothetical protein
LFKSLFPYLSKISYANADIPVKQIAVFWTVEHEHSKSYKLEAPPGE